MVGSVLVATGEHAIVKAASRVNNTTVRRFIYLSLLRVWDHPLTGLTLDPLGQQQAKQRQRTWSKKTYIRPSLFKQA